MFQPKDLPVTYFHRGLCNDSAYGDRMHDAVRFGDNGWLLKMSINLQSLPIGLIFLEILLIWECHQP